MLNLEGFQVRNALLNNIFWERGYLFSLGVWKWTNLRKEGLLKDDFVTPGDGWVRHWDDVTQTPWLFNAATQNYITYDDPQSLNIKVQHALCEDLAGVMVW